MRNAVSYLRYKTHRCGRISHTGSNCLFARILVLYQQEMERKDTTVMAVILIPAYMPDDKLLLLERELKNMSCVDAVVVVDDGSGEACAPVFDALAASGADVLCHAVNLGKGQTIKTGLNHCMLTYPGKAVVTADCDGQHSAHDIQRIAELTDQPQNASALVMGSRHLPKSAPWKSRFGNAVMRGAFLLSTGIKVHDTQTGLRGFPPALLPRLMNIGGTRYEYEMNMLLALAKESVPIREFPIEVIYTQNNAGSHFHPVRDALRVFTRLFAFTATSLVSYCLDYGLYALLLATSGLSLRFCYAVARLISSTFNFILNRNLVFHAKQEPLFKQLLKYYILVAIVMLLGTLGVHLLSGLGINEYIAKPITDTMLYIVSFFGQRLVVFRPKKGIAKEEGKA